MDSATKIETPAGAKVSPAGRSSTVEEGIILLAAAVMAIGTFLPWVNLNRSARQAGFELSWWDRSGLGMYEGFQLFSPFLVLLLAVLTGYLALKQGNVLSMLSMTVVSLLVVGYTLLNVREQDVDGIVVMSWGFYLTLLATLVAAGASYKRLAEIQPGTPKWW